MKSTTDLFYNYPEDSVLIAVKLVNDDKTATVFDRAKFVFVLKWKGDPAILTPIGIAIVTTKALYFGERPYIRAGQGVEQHVAPVQ